MAGAGYKLFNTGDVLTAAQVNTYLMEQTVMVFNDAASRTTALSGVVAEGMLSYLKSTKQVEVYNGSAWVASDDPNAIQNTIVDAKGDLITATAADTPARLAVGNNGDYLGVDSSTSTGLRYNPQNALANPVINGGMDVWQRGTSFAISNSRAYTADRWQGRTSAAVTSNFSRQTVSDSTNLPNIQYALRVQRASGQTATPLMIAEYSMETVNSIPWAGKTVTLSFYARRGANFSGASNNIAVRLAYGTGTDENIGTTLYPNLNYAVDVSQSLTTTWTRYAFTGTIAATTTEMGLQFFYTASGTAGTDDWFEITGVQIDQGTYTASSAPTFRRSGGTLAGELAACQRYYWRSNTGQGYSSHNSWGIADSTTSTRSTVRFPVTMRRRPTSAEFSAIAIFDPIAAAFYSISAIGLDANASSADGAYCYLTNATATTGRTYMIMANNDSAGYIAFSAEL